MSDVMVLCRTTTNRSFICKPPYVRWKAARRDIILLYRGLRIPANRNYAADALAPDILEFRRAAHGATGIATRRFEAVRTVTTSFANLGNTAKVRNHITDPAQ
jgi:hypothetical protein